LFDDGEQEVLEAQVKRGAADLCGKLVYLKPMRHKDADVTCEAWSQTRRGVVLRHHSTSWRKKLSPIRCRLFIARLFELQATALSQKANEAVKEAVKVSRMSADLRAKIGKRSCPFTSRKDMVTERPLRHHRINKV